MTNAMIVLNESLHLMDEGILKSTGRIFVYEDADGNEIQVNEPEPIHTYESWKAMGFQVRKGEKSAIRFPIWKHVGERVKKDGTIVKEHMFLKEACFFTISQVDPIQ